MIKYFFYFFFIILGFTFCSDPSGGADVDPPEPLQVVEKTIQSDTTLTETGIDAVPEDDAILFVWHPFKGINKVTKFKIYRSSDPSGEKNFNLYDEIDIENNFNQDTTFLDNNVNLFYY